LEIGVIRGKDYPADRKGEYRPPYFRSVFERSYPEDDDEWVHQDPLIPTEITGY
jgi:hypothetical protein